MTHPIRPNQPNPGSAPQPSPSLTHMPFSQGHIFCTVAKAISALTFLSFTKIASIEEVPRWQKVFALSISTLSLGNVFLCQSAQELLQEDELIAKNQDLLQQAFSIIKHQDRNTDQPHNNDLATNLYNLTRLQLYMQNPHIMNVYFEQNPLLALPSPTPSPYSGPIHLLGTAASRTFSIAQVINLPTEVVRQHGIGMVVRAWASLDQSS